MSTKFPRIWLSETDLRLLARCSMTGGSRPAYRHVREYHSWGKMIRKGLITDVVGWHEVHWAWLTKGQYRKVEMYRRGL